MEYSPVKRKCQYCGVEVVTFVEHETNSLFLILALILMIIFGLVAMLMVPVLYLMTKDAVHRCSRCLQKLGEKKCFGLPDKFSHDIWQFRLGKCHIVLARLYAIVGIVVICGFSLWYSWMSPSFFEIKSPYKVPETSVLLKATW